MNRGNRTIRSPETDAYADDGAFIDYGAALLSPSAGWTLEGLGIVPGVIAGSTSPLDVEDKCQKVVPEGQRA
jgi:hypothetical protein